MDHYIERVVDLLEPSLNRIHNMSADEARQRVLSGKPELVREIDGSFALLARDGKTVRMARSLDRPMRYFLAKRAEGPATGENYRFRRIAHGQFLSPNEYTFPSQVQKYTRPLATASPPKWVQLSI